MATVAGSPLDKVLFNQPGQLNGIESVFDSLGMMRSPYSPIMRGSLVAAIGAVGVYALRPRIFFDPSGRPRPWSYTSQSEDAVAIPWWSIPAVGFAIGGLFI